MYLLQRSQRFEILGMLLKFWMLFCYLITFFQCCFVRLAYEQRKANAISGPFS